MCHIFACREKYNIIKGGSILKGSPVQGGGEDFIGAIVGIIGAVCLGVLAIAILDSLFSPKCPSCGRLVERNLPYCKNCYSVLEWR